MNSYFILSPKVVQVELGIAPSESFWTICGNGKEIWFYSNSLNIFIKTSCKSPLFSLCNLLSYFKEQIRFWYFVNILSYISNMHWLRRGHSIFLRPCEMFCFTDRLKLPLPLNSILLHFCLERDHWNSKILLGHKYNNSWVYEI